MFQEPNGEISSQLGHPTNMRDFHGIKQIFGCKTYAQKKLWAVFFAFQIYVFVQQGQERTFVLFLQNYPLYWDSIKIGIFLFILYTFSGFGAWPGVPLMLRFCDDNTIAIVALVSKLLGSLFLGFAKTDPLVYVCEYNHYIILIFNIKQIFIISRLFAPSHVLLINCEISLLKKEEEKNTNTFKRFNVSCISIFHPEALSSYVINLDAKVHETI